MRNFLTNPRDRRQPGVDPQHALAAGHGFYYVTTGIWPILSITSFQAVTGRKRDLWLVQTAGLLIASIGSVLMLAAYRRSNSPEVRLLAIASALSLAGIDLVYVNRRKIGPIYLADAAAELTLVALWLATSRSRCSA
jgi:hypothetical protein